MPDSENASILEQYTAFMEERHALMEDLVTLAEETGSLHWLDEEGHKTREVAAPWLPSGVQMRYFYRRAVYVIHENRRLLDSLSRLYKEQNQIMKNADPPMKRVPRALLLPHVAHSVACVNVTAYPSFSSRVEPLPEVYNELVDKLSQVSTDDKEEKRLQGYLDTLRKLWDDGEESLRVRYPNWQVDARLRGEDDAMTKVSLRLVGVACVADEPHRVEVQKPSYRTRKRAKNAVTLEPDAKLGAAYIYSETRWQRAKG